MKLSYLGRCSFCAVNRKLFDIHYRMEGQVQQKKSRTINRWQIETPIPRDRELSSPAGFSNQRIALSQSQAGQRVN